MAARITRVSRSRRSGSAPGRTATARCSSGTTSSACTTVAPPRFVKRYAEIGDSIRSALVEFAADVRERRFPEEQHTYAMPDDELAAFETAVSDHQEHAEQRR